MKFIPFVSLASLSERWLPAVLGVALLGCSLGASAGNPPEADAGPTAALRIVVDGMLEVVGNQKLSAAGKRDAMTELVDHHVDYKAMAQRIVAQPSRAANAEEKARFIDAFRKVLVKTYISMLDTYDGQRVTYVDEKIRKERYAAVDTFVIGGGKKIPVTFRLIQRDGTWRLYDYVVEGLSMVRSYNSSYKPALKRGGVAQLAATLEAQLTSG